MSRRYRSESFLPQTYQTFVTPRPFSPRVWHSGYDSCHLKPFFSNLTPYPHIRFPPSASIHSYDFFFKTFTSPPSISDHILSLHPRVFSQSCDGIRTDIVRTVGTEGVEVTAHRIKLQHRWNARCEDRAIVSNGKTKVPSWFLLNRRRDCHNHDFWNTESEEENVYDGWDGCNLHQHCDEERGKCLSCGVPSNLTISHTYTYKQKGKSK